MVKSLLKPDYIFESSWEVCNKVGGIYTVLSPERIRFKVNLGKDDYKAGDVALVVGGQAVDGQYVSCKDGMVTVEAGALDGFANGEYPVSVVFNNKIYTTVNDKVTITVVNSEAG